MEKVLCPQLLILFFTKSSTGAFKSCVLTQKLTHGTSYFKGLSAGTVEAVLISTFTYVNVKV